MLAFASEQETREADIDSEKHLSDMTDAELEALLDRGRGVDGDDQRSTSIGRSDASKHHHNKGDPAMDTSLGPILVVEDDESQAVLIRSLFEHFSLGAVICIASTGQEVLDYLEAGWS